LLCQMSSRSWLEVLPHIDSLPALCYHEIDFITH
jgi:hypothetical protein